MNHGRASRLCEVIMPLGLAHIRPHLDNVTSFGPPNTGKAWSTEESLAVFRKFGCSDPQPGWRQWWRAAPEAGGGAWRWGCRGEPVPPGSPQPLPPPPPPCRQPNSSLMGSLLSPKLLNGLISTTRPQMKWSAVYQKPQPVRWKQLWLLAKRLYGTGQKYLFRVASKSSCVISNSSKAIWKKFQNSSPLSKGRPWLMLREMCSEASRCLNMLAAWHPSYWERPCPPSLKTWTLTPTVCLLVCVLGLHPSISQPWFLFGCSPWLWFVETPSWWNPLSVYQEHSCSLPSCFRTLVPPMGPWISSMDSMKVIMDLGRWLECLCCGVYSVEVLSKMESLILLLLDRFGQMRQPSWWRRLGDFLPSWTKSFRTYGWQNFGGWGQSSQGT